MMKPNLFSIATKEISQDAFITWFLQWASPLCSGYNIKLHNCATNFVKELIALQITPPETIVSITAGRNGLFIKERIDLWAKVNEDIFLLIEDKTFTGQHSDQLVRYKEKAKEWCDKNGRKLVCVYLKTGSESSYSLKYVKSQGFAVFGRKDFINVMNYSAIENDIFNDFRDKIQTIDYEESQYLEKNIEDWIASDWIGFYKGLEELLDFVNWGLVNPPCGGAFWNAALNWFKFNGYYSFMQIEQGDLCFKIGEVNENRSGVRNSFHVNFMKHCVERKEIERPIRFGIGKYMTIAVVKRKNWLGHDKEKVNMKSVVSRLNDFEELLTSILKNGT